jgi:hypothetical protein
MPLSLETTVQSIQGESKEYYISKGILQPPLECDQLSDLLHALKILLGGRL